MQPTYLPWSGYFSLLDQADIFVFLDDVQLARDTWQVKNRVLGANSPVTLKVPIEKHPLQEKICNIRIDQSNPWIDRHSNTLRQCYSNFEYGEEYVSIILKNLEKRHEFLCDLNVDLIRTLADALEMNTKLIKASDLGCSGKRSEHVAQICKAVGASAYLSPEGARDYLAEDRFEERFNIPLSFLSFDPAAYPQTGHEDFVSHLSIVDVLCRHGLEVTHQHLSESRQDE